MVPGTISPDYELCDHTAKRRELSELQGRRGSNRGRFRSSHAFCPDQFLVDCTVNMFEFNFRQRQALTMCDFARSKVIFLHTRPAANPLDGKEVVHEVIFKRAVRPDR
jgi:hypothetical protein